MKYWSINYKFLILLVIVLSACKDLPPVASQPSGLNVLEFLPPLAGFQQVDEVELDTPDLHDAHPAQRVELWASTFWLQDETGQLVSGQLAILRLALAAEHSEDSARRSHWVTQQLYSAKLSLTYATQQWQAERTARAALGLAGASQRGVWLEQWRLGFPQKSEPFQLHAKADDFALSLSGKAPLEPQQLTLLPGLTNSPLGYVQAPIAATGVLNIENVDHSVSGQLWFDHVWGNGLPVGRGQLGLVQLRVLLNNGIHLQCLQLRRRSGGGVPIGGCTVFNLAVEGISLDRHSLQLHPLPAVTQSGLPLHWLLESTVLQLSLKIKAETAAGTGNRFTSAQPATVEGTYADNEVSGQAWLELSGLSDVPKS